MSKLVIAILESSSFQFRNTRFRELESRSTFAAFPGKKVQQQTVDNPCILSAGTW